jgi:DNA uptake protein ComE-like DNA-binding protein
MNAMTKREKNVVLGILAVCAAGLLFLTLNRYTFYQNYIDLTPAGDVSRQVTKGAAADSGQQSTAQNLQSSTDKEPVAPLQIININTADLYELESLPGIGRVTALNIIDYRTQNGPFTEFDDRQHVTIR